MTDLAALLEAARAKGTDAEYRAWVQTQPSCISGRFSEYVDGEGRCVAAHIRRAGESGTAYKGEFACVPLRQDEHLTQHQRGEAGCLERHLGGKWTAEQAKDFFDRERLKHLRLWLEAQSSQ